jgi:hypothetical protein
MDFVASFIGGTIIPVLEPSLGPRIAFWISLLNHSLFGKYDLVFYAVVLPLSGLYSLPTYTIFGVCHIFQLFLPLIHHIWGTATDSQYYRSMGDAEGRVVLYFGPALAFRQCRRHAGLLWTMRWWIVTMIYLGRASIIPATVFIWKLYYIHDLSLTGVTFQAYEYLTTPVYHQMTDDARHERSIKTSSSDSFQYNPLEAAREFRLLRINPGARSREPSCDLVHAILENASPFEAVSYTWGPVPPSIPISVGSHSMLVTAAVDDFIFSRHSIVHTQYVWIDAICIDQQNMAEKTKQLPLMTEIYSRCSRVIVWLSPPADVKAAQRTRMLLHTLSNPTYSPGMLLCKTRLNLIDTLCRTVANQEAAFIGVAQLLCHPWFERIWVLQEMAVGKNVHVMFSGVCVEWDVLATAAREMFSDADVYLRLKLHLSARIDRNESAAAWSSALFHLLQIKIMSETRGRRDNKDASSLGVHISQTTNFKATNPKDRIFALIGIASDREAIPFKPDYEDSDENVFIKTSSYLLSTPSWFMTLAMTGRGYGSIVSGTRSTLQDRLPSWASDYSGGLLSGRRGGAKGAEQRADRHGRVTATADPRVMEIQVAELDTIEHIMKIPGPEDPEDDIGRLPNINNTYDEMRKKARHNTNSKLARIHEWYMKARNMVLHLATSRGQSEEEALQVFWETCMMEHDNDDCDPITSPLIPLDLRSTTARKLFEYFISTDTIEWDPAQTPQAQYLSVEGIPIPDALEYWQPLGRRFSYGTTGKSFCITASGRLALVPLLSMARDRVVHVRGGYVPAVLRQNDCGARIGEWVGTCYVHGVEDIYSGQDWKPFLLI